MTYLSLSRSPRYSLTFALPLLLAYEALAFALSGSATEGVRNGADVLLKSLFLGLGGRQGLLIFDVLLLTLGGYLVWRDRFTGGPWRWGVVLGMAGESLLYGLLFGGVAGLLTVLLLEGPSALALGGGLSNGLGLPTQVMLSLGAGIYEELLFRVLLVSGIALAWRTLFGGPRMAGVVATVVGALIFSAFHYIGPYGDRFTLATFAFRAIAGVLFSALYLTRGFGITAWTHAIYDILLTFR